MIKLCDIIHPEAMACQVEWMKWRLTYEGGDTYIDYYLRKFKREKQNDWNERRALTYVPPFAKEGVNEVKNAVFQRLNDVTRSGGSQSYVDACKGQNGGVDRKGSTMASFIGRTLLAELLTMREVGVWVDMPLLPEGATLLDADGKHPYLCYYRVEDIRSWKHDDEGHLTSVLLKECVYVDDPMTGLPTGEKQDVYRFASLKDGKVYIRVEDNDGNAVGDPLVIDIPFLPFVIYEIDHSLLQDCADMQKALLNMESSDVYWCVKANFPIYTEQFDPRPGASGTRPAQQGPKLTVPNPPFAAEGSSIPAGQAKEASEGKDQEVTLGITSGRRYGKELERPGFIHPSSEPIMASMQKEQKIKEDIRRSIHLSVAMLDPNMASAASKEMDNAGLQNGLLAIGAALEQGDREVARLWAAYERSQPSTIRYPEEWTMQSDAGRRADAQALCNLKDQIPSRTVQKEILKQAACKLIGHKVAPEVLDKGLSEIDAAQCLTTNIDDLKTEVELRIVSGETASRNRGYPAGEHKKALAEQAEQLAIIAISQSQGAGSARGVPGAVGDKGSSNEKKLDANATGTPKDNTRGEAQ